MHILLLMPVYNLLEYIKNYKKTTGSQQNYYRDEPTIDDDDDDDDNGYDVDDDYDYDDEEINHYLKSKSFDYKSSVIGKLGNINNDFKAKSNNIKIVIPLKHFINFWRILNITLINCEVSLTLTWSKAYLILSKAKRDTVAATRLSATNVSDELFVVDV